MKKACSRCGKIHDLGKRCYIGVRASAEDRRLRARSAWHRKAEQIKRDAKGLCEVCMDEGVYTYENLETHHIVKLRENPERLLDEENLICLCTRHHKMADAGEISVSYLLELVRRRRGDTPPSFIK